MKKKMRNGFSLLLAALAVFALAGCPTEAVDQPSGSASVSSITIAGVKVEPVPTGTPFLQYEKENFSSADMDTADAIIPEDQFTGAGSDELAAQVKVGVASGATVYFFKAIGGNKPLASDQGWTTNNSINIKDKEFLYIQVTSADKRSMNYYRVRINKVNPDALIKVFSVNGQNIGMSAASGGATPGAATLKDVSLTFGINNISVPITAIANQAAAKVEYGLVRAGSTAEPQFNNTTQYNNLDEGDKVYVKITPTKSDAAANYYGITIRTTLRISSVNIGGAAQAIATDGKTSATAGTDVTGVDVRVIQQTVSTVLSVTKGTGVNVEYSLVASGSPSYEVLGETSALPDSDALPRDSKLYIKTTAAGFEDKYYVFNIAKRSNIASLTGVTVGGTAKDLPTPNTAWASAVPVVLNFGGSPPASIVLVATPRNDFPMTVTYIMGDAAPTGATNWMQSGTFSTSLVSGNYITVRVVSDSETVTNYYRYRIAFGNSATAISGITVAGKEHTALGTPAIDYAAATEGSIYLTSAQLAASRTIVVSSADDVTVRVGTSTSNTVLPTNYEALTKAGNGPYTFTGTGPTAAFAATTRLAIEVTAADKVTTSFYQVRVTTANNAAMGTMTIGGVDKAASGFGVPAGSWDAAGTFGNAAALILSTAQATNAALSHSDGNNPGTVTWAKTAAAATDPTSLFGTGNITFADGDFLYVKFEYTDNGNTYRNIYRTPVKVVTSTDATISKITIADDIDVTGAGLGTPKAAIADVVVPGTASVPTAKLSSANIAVTTEPSATVKYVQKASGSVPIDSEITGTLPASSVTLTAGNVLWFKSVAEDGSTTLYYAITIPASSDATITSVTVASKNATLGTPKAAIGDVIKGSVDIPTAGLSGASLAVVAADTGATVTYVLKTDATAPNDTDFGSNAVPNADTLTAGGAIWLRSVAKDATTTLYYAITIPASSDATITSVTVASKNATLGTPKAAIGDVIKGSVDIPTADLSGASLAVVAADTGAIVTYVLKTDATAPTDTEFGNAVPNADNLTAGGAIWLRSVAKDATTTLYYAITIPASSDAEISGLDINSGTSATLVTGAATIAGVIKGSVSIGSSYLTNAALAVTTADTGATVTYVLKADATAPADADFNGNSVPGNDNLADDNVIWLRSVAADGKTTLYYAVTVSDAG